MYFSYHPVITLGTSDKLNLEISLALIWLVVFDVFMGWLLVRERKIKEIFRKWPALLFLGFLGLSIIWSGNPLRGALVTGVLGLIYIAGYGMYIFRDLIWGKEFRKKFWRVFYGAALVAVGWCVLQCVLDIMGVGREYTLLCQGCTYKMFGFPHPNGMAIEPQFMGNLLLAPTLMMGWRILQSKEKKARRDYVIFMILVMGVFLTFSRGAIYGMAIGLGLEAGYIGIKEKSWRGMKILGAVVLSFLVVLNLQGVMTQASRTNDTYRDGVEKVLNQLSLGLIKTRGEETKEKASEEKNHQGTEQEKSPGEAKQNEGEEAVFDGYVEESTETRLTLSESAMKVWRENLGTILFGVGIGGAGQALYEQGLSPAPKNIVQNQYVSLLLETGLVGVGLLGLCLWLFIREAKKSKMAALLYILMIVYGITVCFFSGLPNVLHIYLLMPLFLLALANSKTPTIKD